MSAATPGNRRDWRHPPATVARLLADSFACFADRIAVVAPGRASLTYDGLRRQSEETARVLAAAGFGRGSRIGVALPDGPELAVAVVALLGTATCVPLGPALTEDALYGLLAAASVDALVVLEGVDTAASRAAQRAGVPLLRLRVLRGSGAGSFDLDAGQPRPAKTVEAPGLDDIAIVTFTSGTTSVPKVVPFTHRLLAESARNRVALGRIGAGDRCLLLTPLHSSAGIRRGLLPPLLVGGSVACPVEIHGEALVDALVEMKSTQFVASPALQIALLEAYERRRPRPAHALKLIFSAHAALTAAVRARVETTFGVPVIEAYGMTETGSIAETPFPPHCAPAGSVGRPTTLQVAVADQTGRLLGTDETGEIIVRGAEVIAGYENNEPANREAFRDGWFRTGDAGRIDGDGFVYLSGRIKEIVNRGGVKIAPAEVEEALARHPAVVEAAAFARPHPTLGEDLAAAVVLRDGAATTESELRDFLGELLPSFKVPAIILTLARLPRGSLDKPNRRELARLAAERQLAGDEAPLPGVETVVARLFAEVLAVPRVGRADDFFARGGDSLRAVRLVAGIEESLGLTVTLDLLFDHPTVALLAREIEALLHVVEPAGAGSGRAGAQAGGCSPAGNFQERNSADEPTSMD